MMWGFCEEALAVVRDAHWQALAATVLLEDRIERISHSVSCGHWWLVNLGAQAAINADWELVAI